MCVLINTFTPNHISIKKDNGKMILEWGTDSTLI